MTDEKTNLQLRRFIENIERCEDEKKEITKQISDIYSEAASNGFDVKVMKKIVAIRKMPYGERSELENLIETYKEALEME